MKHNKTPTRVAAQTKAPSNQMSLLLPVAGGPKKRAGKVGGVEYRSSEFYEIRDRLVSSLPEKKKT